MPVHTRRIMPRDKREFTATGAVDPGEVVIFNGLLGVYVGLQKLASGDRAMMQVEGLVELPKATGTTAAAEAKIYWDDTNKVLTTTASGNTYAGTCAYALTNGPTIGVVDLNKVQSA
jgi:predicted RecA/RadA family phage recombinase